MATDAYTRMIQVMQRQQAAPEFLLGDVLTDDQINIGGNVLDKDDDYYVLDSVGVLSEGDEVLAVEIEIEDDDDETFYVVLGKIKGR
jgi:hypothetical protein